ncbi:hypothetical protein HPB49_008514 [Dermacentor silvarum]|uniref:Uncharacterized protein n=1 Tax=Dermacentor silvarum TaxID=543639 RepID=A0ACB8DXQ1_DERSI|nr:hypothetical protein HPB49_008514 [Dermacentor silvarum]
MSTVGGPLNTRQRVQSQWTQHHDRRTQLDSDSDDSDNEGRSEIKFLSPPRMKIEASISTIKLSFNGYGCGSLWLGGRGPGKRAARREPDDSPAHGSGQFWRQYADADAWPPPSTWLRRLLLLADEAAACKSRRQRHRRCAYPPRLHKSVRCASHVPSSPASFVRLLRRRSRCAHVQSADEPRSSHPAHPRHHSLSHAPVAPAARTQEPPASLTGEGSPPYVTRLEDDIAADLGSALRVPHGTVPNLFPNLPPGIDGRTFGPGIYSRRFVLSPLARGRMEGSRERRFSDSAAAKHIGTAWTFRLPQSCTGPQDCLHDECCVVGMQRYSVPQCQKLGQIGDTCRPYNAPENRTLWYPYNGGVQQKNMATYTLLCPCAGGLHCTAAQCQPGTLGDQVDNDLAGIYDEYQ